MKRAMVVSLILAALLSGCAAQAVSAFYVEDTLPTPEAPVFDVTFAVPDDAVLAGTSEDGRRQEYAAADGRYTITAEILPGSNAEQAATAVSGFSLEAVSPLKTERHGMNEYRFCWCSETDDGLQVCTCAILEDEACCYTLVFAAEEASAKACRDVCTQVIDSFSLFEDEGF